MLVQVIWNVKVNPYSKIVSLSGICSPNNYMEERILVTAALDNIVKAKKYGGCIHYPCNNRVKTINGKTTIYHELIFKNEKLMLRYIEYLKR